MKILVTGGSGFIGRNLVEYLSENYEIIAPTHHEMDLLDPVQVNEILKNSNIDTVIHCATWDATRFSKKDPSKVLDHNLKMYFTLAHNHQWFRQMFYFGSGAEFTREYWKPLMPEDYFGKHIPADPYGLSKYVMNLHSNCTTRIYNFRLFGVYGKYEDYWVRFISNIIFQCIQRGAIIVDQERRFDYLYIKDLVPIIKFFLKSDKYHGDFNISTTESISLKEIVEIINEVGKFKSKISIDKKNYNYQYTGSNQKLKKTIPHLKITSYEDSIKDFSNYLKGNLETIDKDAIIQDEYFKKSKIKTS